MSISEQVQTRIADTAAVTAGVAATWSWASINEVAQFVATCIAIVSGLAALAYHVRKYLHLRGEHNANRKNSEHRPD